MSNYKVKVNNKAESKEVQELFFELGFWWKGGDDGEIFNFSTPEHLINRTNGFLTVGDDNDQNRKELTIQQLRDLVVLKRNDVGDATHTDGHYSFYVGKDKNYFFYSCDKAWRGTWKNVDILKPIEKPMKEYLRKNSNGTYSYIGTVQPEHVSDFMIEIPEGAQVYAVNNGYHYFFSSAGIGFEWSVLWQRPSHPEELPFIDDEPKLDTQMACMEREFERDQCMENARREGLLGDPRIGAPLNTYDEPRVDTYKSEFGIEPPISLNNQYAEIEQVRQELNGIDATLAERQATYGCFEDVARTTEQIMEALGDHRVNGLQDLPHTHRMALYMIASKMSRIVNGDFNHRDSWHDIGGYAKLVEDLL